MTVNDYPFVLEYAVYFSSAPTPMAFYAMACLSPIWYLAPCGEFIM